MSESQKQCCRCKVHRQKTEFNKNKSNKDGLHYVCKPCRLQERQKSRDHNIAKSKEYYAANKEKLLQASKRYRETHTDSIRTQRKQYRETHVEKIREAARAYLPIRKERIKELRLTDADFRLSEVLRSKVHKMLSGLDTSYRHLIACSNEHLRLWLQFQFEPGMTWQNYGTYWHIDHILAINLFNLQDRKNQTVCFHWTNLQPLTRFDNQSKSDRLMPHYYWNSVVSVHRFIQKYRLDHSGYQALRESLAWLRKRPEVW